MSRKEVDMEVEKPAPVFFNEFSYTDVWGLEHRCTEGRRYSTREEAESSKYLAPDSRWEYVQTHQESPQKETL